MNNGLWSVLASSGSYKHDVDLIYIINGQLQYKKNWRKMNLILFFQQFQYLKSIYYQSPS